MPASEVKNTKLKLATVLFLLVLTLAVFSAKTLADTATGQAAVTNVAPTIYLPILYNSASADAAITLTAGSTVTIKANATITDTNGAGDIASANATLFHSSSSDTAANDENIHFSNSSCTLGSANGNNKTVECSFILNFMTTNGTWTVNITAYDGAANATGRGADTNTVSDLASLDVAETTIDFSTLALGANTTSAQSMTIRNLGNIVIDSQFSGTNYTCTVGTIDAANTRYNLTTAGYDGMTTALANAAATQTNFDLGIRGTATGNGLDSNKTEYWNILLPSTGIGGTCTDTLTATAIAS